MRFQRAAAQHMAWFGGGRGEQNEREWRGDEENNDGQRVVTRGWLTRSTARVLHYVIISLTQANPPTYLGS